MRRGVWAARCQNAHGNAEASGLGRSHSTLKTSAAGKGYSDFADTVVCVRAAVHGRARREDVAPVRRFSQTRGGASADVARAERFAYLSGRPDETTPPRSPTNRPLVKQPLDRPAKRGGYAEAAVSELELSELVVSSSLFISVGQTEPSGSEAEQVAMSAGMELSLFMSSETVTNS